MSARSNQCTHLLTHLISLLGLHPSNNFPPFPTGKTLYYVNRLATTLSGREELKQPKCLLWEFLQDTQQDCDNTLNVPRQCCWCDSAAIQTEDTVHERHEATHMSRQTAAAWKGNERKLPWDALFTSSGTHATAKVHSIVLERKATKTRQ